MPVVIIGACGFILGCGANQIPTRNNSAVAAADASSSGSLPAMQAWQSDAFVDSIGVVTHLTYTDTPYYTAFPQIFNLLQYLGVRHIRDGFYPWSAATPFYAEHQLLHSAGIGTDYVVPFRTSTTASQIEQFAPRVHDMEALEAPNECDVAGNCGNASLLGSVADMLGFLPVINQAGRNLGVPVFGPSFTQPSTYPAVGNLAPEMNYNNLHVYFGGRNPGSSGWGGPDAEGNAYGSFAFWLDQANIDAPNKPTVVTETGYMSFAGRSIPWTLPPDVESSYILRTLLLSWKAGIRRTYIYELLDEVSSPGYGLLKSDLSPKPAFTAIQNLIANLWDKGPSFTPGKLQYLVQGGDSTLNQMLFQKRDGSFWLILWLEQSSFDPESFTRHPVTSQQVTLKLDPAYVVPNIGQFDTSGRLNWSSTSQTGSIALTVSDQPTMVKILPQQ